VVLVVWAIALQAPIEEPANPTKAPNPSKAPWYFLGLQEMLVYFDPWLAGVVFPSLIIFGLMALPYFDTNPKGNGYYTFAERKREVFLYMFGFVVLWVLLIIQGTFLRGPNWTFFGPYEEWDLHKLAPLNNVNLSEIIFVKILGSGLPSNWFLREMVGIVLVPAYFILTPLLLAKKWWKPLYEKMGPARFYLATFLITFMFLLPIKMALRWAFNLKYFIAIPEYSSTSSLSETSVASPDHLYDAANAQGTAISSIMLALSFMWMLGADYFRLAEVPGDLHQARRRRRRPISRRPRARSTRRS
jgi:hypothetical protein